LIPVRRDAHDHIGLPIPLADLVRRLYAAIYVTLHIVVAHFSRAPGSRFVWFFSVLTGPLTRRIRSILPDGMTESQVRYLTLGACIVIWLATRLVLAGLGGVDQAGRE
jgi:hypothetical protein